jgi:hypothetical protein
MKKSPPEGGKAWKIAPMPRFLEPELATALVREGYYHSVEEAYLEVEQTIKDKIRARCAEYLENYRYPICWQVAQAPGHS